MKKIPLILGGILVICIIALIAIDSTSHTPDEIECMEMGFPTATASVPACAQFLKIQRNIYRLRKDLDRLKKELIPGIDI